MNVLHNFALICQKHNSLPLGLIQPYILLNFAMNVLHNFVLICQKHNSLPLGSIQPYILLNFAMNVLHNFVLFVKTQQLTTWADTAFISFC